MSQKEYSYSFDNESFKHGTFDSIADAIADAEENNEDYDHIYVGEVTQQTNAMFFPDGDWIINEMACAADDVGGEYAESYPDCSKEEVAELTEDLHKLLNTWCDKHNIKPDFYSVGKTTRYSIKRKGE